MLNDDNLILVGRLIVRRGSHVARTIVRHDRAHEAILAANAESGPSGVVQYHRPHEAPAEDDLAQLEVQ